MQVTKPIAIIISHFVYILQKGFDLNNTIAVGKVERGKY